MQNIPKIWCIPQLYVTLQSKTKNKMKQEINPKDTNRAIAFELWTKSPDAHQDFRCDEAV